MAPFGYELVHIFAGSLRVSYLIFLTFLRSKLSKLLTKIRVLCKGDAVVTSCHVSNEPACDIKITTLFLKGYRLFIFIAKEWDRMSFTKF